MFGVTTSDDYQPVTWVGRHPVACHDAARRRCTSLLRSWPASLGFGGAGILDIWSFDSAQVWQRGEVWQIVTYAFVHAPSGALLWFAVEMYMLFVFGREVERFIGRRAFIILYRSAPLGADGFFSLWGLWAARSASPAPPRCISESSSPLPPFIQTSNCFCASRRNGSR